MTPRFKFYSSRLAGIALIAIGLGAGSWLLITDNTRLIRFQAGLLFFGVFVAGTAMWRMGDRIRRTPAVVKAVAEALADLGSEPFVLYLRSFAADQDQARAVSASHFRTQEQRLASVLSWVGRPVAVGSPADDRPFAGFERAYLGDDWQVTVEGLLDRARLVVLRVGSTRGFLWELERSLDVVPTDRLVWLVDDMAAYAQLEEVLRGHGVELPPLAVIPGGAVAVVRSEGGRLTVDVVRLRGIDYLVPLLGDRRIERSLKQVMTRTEARRPSALWLLGTNVAVVLLFLFVSGAPPFGPIEHDYADALLSVDLIIAAGSPVTGDFVPPDFDVIEERYLHEIEIDDLGGEVVLAEVDFDSPARGQSIAVAIRAVTGWPRISDSRGLIEPGEPVADLANDLCGIVEDRFGAVSQSLDEINVGDGGWSVVCALPTDDSANPPRIWENHTVKASVLVDDTLVIVDVFSSITPLCAPMPPIDPLLVARRVVAEFGWDDPAAAPMPRPDPERRGYSFSAAVREVSPIGIGEYGDFYPVSGEDLAIVTCVPTDWSDGDAQPVVIGGVNLGPALVVAPDIAAFRDGWTTPGLAITVMGRPPASAVEFLDAVGPAADCSFVGRYDYNDGRYQGQWDLWEDCGATGSHFISATAEPPDGDFLILLQIAALEARDFAAADMITASLVIREDLIPNP